jgi:hypothetical protein
MDAAQIVGKHESLPCHRYAYAKRQYLAPSGLTKKTNREAGSKIWQNEANYHAGKQQLTKTGIVNRAERAFFFFPSTNRVTLHDVERRRGQS